MRIELFRSPEERDPGKKYPRYKMSGYDLFEQIFKEYEVDFEAEYLERLKKEQQEKERKDRAIKGKCICGIYTGNIYGNSDNGYMHDTRLRAYFASENGCTYLNKKFQKVHNVRVVKVVCDNMTRYEFNRWEDIINAYLEEYNLYYEQAEVIKRHIELAKSKSKVKMKCHPECLVRTDIDDLHDTVLGELENIMQEIVERLRRRIDTLRENGERN